MLRGTMEAQLRLRDRAMAASSCGITIADLSLPDMPLIYINEAFQQITGYTSGETLGHNCRFLQREDRDQPGLVLLRDALVNGLNCTITLRNYRRDGTLFWNELFCSPVLDENNRLTHFVGIQTDITARKLTAEALAQKQTDLEQAFSTLRETQAMLVHSEKMSALGQMVAGIAHEINNPLSFVNSNLHSLRIALHGIFEAYGQLETAIHADAAHLIQHADTIRRSSDFDFISGDVDDLLASSLEGLSRVKKIVEVLRIFSRLDEAEMKSVGLQENVQSTLVIARGVLRDRVRVVVELQELPPIVCCPAELNQVFLNLIVNAAQAISDTGTILIRGREAGDHVLLEVADDGVGMPPDVLRQIFNPFFTTKPPGDGTGLGLAIAYKIVVDRHRGAISVESTPGVGTVFTILLPKEQPL